MELIPLDFVAAYLEQPAAAYQKQSPKRQANSEEQHEAANPARRVDSGRLLRRQRGRRGQDEK